LTDLRKLVTFIEQGSDILKSEYIIMKANLRILSE